MVTFTQEETDDMKARIAKGELPPDAYEKHLAAEARNVFGQDFKVDKHGKPIEQGIGSAAQPTANSVLAYEIHCKEEPDYAENLARMKRELADYQAKQKAKAQ